MRTIETLIGQGLPANGVKVRCLGHLNVLRGVVKRVRDDGLAIVAGRDLFGAITMACAPRMCEVVE